MKVLVHQPEYLPWIGFWNRLSKADMFVALDTATHQKHGFIKRNKIKTQTGWDWIGAALLHESSFTKIKDLLVDNTKPWKERQISLVKENYAKAPYASEHITWFEAILSKPWDHMVDLNIYMLKEVCGFLGIRVPIVLASSFGIETRATDALVDICKAVGADSYISGPGKREGKEGYMEQEKFSQAGIQLLSHEFTHPEYMQQFMNKGFSPYMSILDVLLNEGPQSARIAKEGGSLTQAP